MPKPIKVPKVKHPNKVMLGIWMDPQLRTQGQAAIKLLGFGDMTNYFETQLRAAINEAGIKNSKKPLEEHDAKRQLV